MNGWRNSCGLATIPKVIIRRIIQEFLKNFLKEFLGKCFAAKYKRSTENVALRWLLQRGLATIPKLITKRIIQEFFRNSWVNVLLRIITDPLQMWFSDGYCNVYWLQFQGYFLDKSATFVSRIIQEFRQ